MFQNKKPLSGIYMITNKTTGQKYIGRSCNIYKRWTEHCSGRSKNDPKISSDIKKYGSTNFTLDIIEKLEPNDNILNEREIYWIEKYNTFKNPFHYNQTPGGWSLSGEKNPFYGKKHSSESKQKMSEKHKGKKLSKEHIEKISKANKGKNNPRYGMKVSKETRIKISQANKGRKFTIQDKLKMSQSKNSSGFFRVTKQNDAHCKQGFMWAYHYMEEGKQKTIVSTKLKDLEQKVKLKRLLWKKI